MPMRLGVSAPLTLLSSILIVAPGLALASYPALGQSIVGRRWYRVTLCIVVSIAAVGCLLQHFGLLERRLVAGFWAPLYSLVIYFVAVRVFVRCLGRYPRDVVYVFEPGLGWDRLFFFCVALLSITPFFFVVAPR